jgi:outer membrane protein assembly factor BamA
MQLMSYSAVYSSVKLRSNSYIIHFAYLFLLLSGICLPLLISAQKNYTCNLVLTDTSGQKEFQKLRKDFNEKKTYRDSIEVMVELSRFRDRLQNSGYAAAGIDSVIRKEKNFTAYLFLGNHYEWLELKNGNINSQYLDGTGIKGKGFEGEKFSYKDLSRIENRIIQNCENNGYPFATVRLDSIELKNNSFYAILNLEKNRLVRLDSIILKGDALIAPVYIYNYIGIFPGDIYNEAQLQKISTRLRELAFVQEVKPAQVIFNEKETKLYLFLSNKKASQFDGVVGVLPDDSKTGKVNFTGEVHLKLQNSLHRGETIELNWRQIPPKSQDLKVHLFYPFLFNTPFGLDGNLNIFRKDTTYLDVIKILGIQYSLTGNNYIKVFVNDKESNLQNTSGLENITVLPPYADIKNTSYGLTIHYEKLDYRLNPRRGLAFEVTGSTGNRKIKKNSGINPIVYETLKLQSVTYQGELAADHYFSPGGKNVINTGFISGYIYNQDLFANELFRIGGLKSLRGFDEESIYASAYTILKAEYRYLLEQNSFLFLFINGAWYENRNRNEYIRDTPLGMGAGINFETKLGIMSVSYALGKQFDNPIYFRNGKIHFGIVNYF